MILIENSNHNNNKSGDIVVATKRGLPWVRHNNILFAMGSDDGICR